MIVIGSDPHKRNHCFAGVERALGWARRLDGERVWAIEDCRHVSGSLERFLVARGERVVRVPPRWMAGARRGGRERGKSDPIDATAVARAAIREGVETLPAAFLDEHALEIRLLLDHHDDLVKARSADQSRLRWHLHDLECPIDVPAAALERAVWLERLARWLARQPQNARVRIARRLVAAIRARTREIRALERELALLVNAYRPELLALPGCGPLTAAKLINAGRHDPDTTAYLARKQAEGKTRTEALRCLKRHLARRVHHTLTVNANAPANTLALT
jgi:transposase